MARPSAYDILNRKRRGESLRADEIEWFISGYTLGNLPDYQMSALLMAIAIQGADRDETAALTRTMLSSGETWQMSRRFEFIADKHSTGGVGDKVSLILAPWVAACGVNVGMLSGRGLGHTGGTLDKLDSIPRFNARLSREEFERCVETAGCVIATSTEGIAPADRRMYALRDVTGTVESIPLITASIMSKKLALGASALVLDVKAGNGAFCRDVPTARDLAHSLIAAAEGSETRVEAMITDMNQPLGRAVGNANEVIEAFEVLAGRGPQDLIELTRAQGARMLVMSGRFSEDEAFAELDDVRRSGKALDQGCLWLEAQGADPDSVLNGRLPRPKETLEVIADRSGCIGEMNAYAIGMLAIELGCGRRTQDDAIDYAAGFLFDRRSGEEVRAGEVIARIGLGDRPVDRESIRSSLAALMPVVDEPPAETPLIHEILRREGS